MEKGQRMDEVRGFQALRDHPDSLQYLLDTIICGILTLDRQGRVVYSNNSARRLLGISRTDLIGSPLDTSGWRPLDGGRRPAGDEFPFARVLKEGEKVEGEIFALEDGPSGRLFFALNAAPLRDEGGEISGAVADLVDITEHTRAQQERERLTAVLRESEHRYRQLADSAPVGVFECDGEGCWIYVNPRWSAISGRGREESLEFGWTGAIHPEEREEVLEKWRKSAGEPGTWHCEYRLLHPEGREVWVRTLKSPAVLNGESGAHFVGTVEDITAGKEAQLALHRAKEAAEEASRAKSRFLSTVSHEIRTPMTVFMGMVELTLERGLPPEQSRFLETAYDAAESLLLLIEDILDYAELETGRLQLGREEFDPLACVREAVDRFSDEAGRKGVALRLEGAADAPRRWRGDPRRLRQVLRNLVGNAVKFTEEGEVTVTVEQSRGEAGASPSLLFSVRDTGIGIPADKMNRLFQPFSQVDPSDTRRFGGTGLGLAISRALVERMGGRIRAESVPGRGSLFAFTLPA